MSDRPSLLSVSAVLVPSLTGLENVRLGLLAKGIDPRRAEDLAHAIADWADIGDAVHRPLSTYSSGMAARLKFAIATALEPKILLVDEALATGDAAFNRRAQDRMDEFLDNAGTVFIVSHTADTIAQHCTRALWLHHGELIADVSARRAVEWYKKWSSFKSAGDDKNAADIIAMLRRFNKPKRIIYSHSLERR